MARAFGPTRRKPIKIASVHNYGRYLDHIVKNDERVYVCSSAKKPNVWNVIKDSVKKFSHDTFGMDFTADRKFMVTSSYRGIVTIWKCFADGTHENICEMQIANDGTYAFKVKISSKNMLAIAPHFGFQMHDLSNPSSPKFKWSCQKNYGYFEFSHDGNTIGCVNLHGGLEIIDVETGVGYVYTFPNPILIYCQSFSFSLNGTFATVHMDGSLCIWKIVDNQKLEQIGKPIKFSDDCKITRCKFSETNPELLAISTMTTVTNFKPKANDNILKVLHSIEVLNVNNNIKIFSVYGHENYVARILFSGKDLFSGSWDGTVVKYTLPNIELPEKPKASSDENMVIDE